MANKKPAKAQNESPIAAIRNALNAAFVERQEIIDGMLIALIARENLFMLGPPGTGKSAVCNALCGAIDGSFFSWLMGKTTAPEELYGPPSFAAIKEDRYVRVTTGKLPEAKIAFLDEIWKSSSAIANTLLPIINERTFFNGNGAQKIPLEMMVSASNELPIGEELGALWDRFALRYVTRAIQDDSNFMSIMRGGAAQIPQMSSAQLASEQAAAMALEIPNEVMEAICKIRRECVQQGLYVSDRKWVQISRIIRAQAHLSGHKEVEVQDLEILQHVLWNDDKQVSMVRKLVYKFAYDIGEELMEIQDGVQEIVVGLEEHIGKTGKEAARALTEFGIESSAKLKVLNERVKKLRKTNPDMAKILDLENSLQKMSRRLNEQALGFSL